jgi:hypothetical protein
VLLAAGVLAACTPQSEPRTISDFMEDGFARDGVLARCNQDPDAASADEECALARRAAAAVALEAERRGRQSALDRESEVKLLAMREREARQAPAGQDAAASSVPAFGAPVGAAMPAGQSASFDVYAEGSQPLGRRTLEIEAAEPPPNTIQIDSPQLVLTDLAIAPGPFRTEEPVQQ